MRIIILGGDGFCGWPTALELSISGHQVHIIDNFSRREIDKNSNTNSLTPIASIETRIKKWNEFTGKNIGFCFIDLKTQYQRLVEYIRYFEPDAIIHFAEQRSAPYSMKDFTTKRYTIENNVTVTHNVLSAICEVNKNIHLIHLGTMGVYGYNNQITVKEGYVSVDFTQNENKITKEILFPFDPGSIYHLTKCLDSQIFSYFQKAFNLRITDLHQGIIWGTQTKNTLLDESLLNRFDYDSDYGTFVNRMLLQSITKIPLTIYGTGNQQRAFININDMITSIKYQIENIFEFSKVRILNQMTEVHKLNDIVEIIKDKLFSETSHLKNPRKEIENNQLTVENNTIKNILNPILLKEHIFDEIDLISNYKNNIIYESINPKSFW